VQQGAQDAAHVRVVVNHQESQAVEVDADHGDAGYARRKVGAFRDVTEPALRKGLG
jgi:hypothetical protein